MDVRKEGAENKWREINEAPIIRLHAGDGGLCGEREAVRDRDRRGMKVTTIETKTMTVEM